MDKFENIIRKAVEGYEAPYNPAAWDAISNQLGGNDSFEDSIRDSVENFEAPYDAAAWTAVAGELDNLQFEDSIRDSVENYEADFNPAAWDAVSRQLGPSQSLFKWIAGSAAIVAALFGSVYFFSDSPQKEDNPLIARKDNHTSPVTDHTVPVVDHTNNDSTDSQRVTSDHYAGTENPDQNNDVAVSLPDEVNHGDNNALITPADNSNIIPDDNSGIGSNDNLLNTIPPATNNPLTTLPEKADDTDHHITGNNTGTSYSALIEMQDIVGCQGEVMTFAAKNPDQDCNYFWEFSDGSIEAGPVVEHKFAQSGNYTATLSLRKGSDHGVLSSSTQDVIINPVPTADFSWERTDAVPPMTKFKNLSTAYTSVSWNVPGRRGEVSNKDEFEHMFRNKGTYSVELTAVNNFGCSQTVRKEVEIEEDYNLLAPNTFSPDGDGLNDYFIPVALKMMQPNFTMTIWSPDKGLVYQTKNASMPWDGRFTFDNTLAPEGAYVWQVQLINADGETEWYQGQIILMRHK